MLFRQIERRKSPLTENLILRASPNLLCICVDADGSDYFYRMYHCLTETPIVSHELGYLILEADNVFGRVRCPQAAVADRSFRDRSTRAENFVPEERNLPMCEHDLTNRRGEKGTFVVHVQYRQNATWQGTVVWADKNKSQQFRSALELMKLIDSALDESEA